ncbi:MAG: hypothetical protein IPK82_06140 [Polyangiaceae bacterium]|nr:hypothetical protein [Polyangiaceae bacterium]
MPRLIWLLTVSILLTGIACVRRPPPIVSPSTVPPPAGPQCTVETGIDVTGDPSCSAGCQWSRTARQCVVSTAPPAKFGQPAPSNSTPLPPSTTAPNSTTAPSAPPPGPLPNEI